MGDVTIGNPDMLKGNGDIDRHLLAPAHYLNYGKPDLVVVDLDSVFNSYSIFSSVYNLLDNMRFSDGPVVGVTGSDVQFTDFIKLAIKSGIDISGRHINYLPKPFSMRMVKRFINDLLTIA
ncbi:hypothetical protein [Vibrio splendidus]|uniref:hypothetical protein n=1 Tax=Vibrio splendidus TaxID=29497 RepID=UPI000D34FF67|nr:hypothetical protein [Vibrio splendidus]PTP50618.1 hypothetical protein CWO05_19935 [Vibrio splendidus]